YQRNRVFLDGIQGLIEEGEGNWTDAAKTYEKIQLEYSQYAAHISESSVWGAMLTLLPNPTGHTALARVKLHQPQTALLDLERMRGRGLARQAALYLATPYLTSKENAEWKRAISTSRTASAAWDAWQFTHKDRTRGTTQNQVVEADARFGEIQQTR